MDEGTEIEDRVDLDDDNYEEMDDDVEEQLEDEGAGEVGDETGEDQHEDLKSEDSGRERSPELDVVESDRSIITDEPVGDKEKQTASIDDDDEKKRAELLALPPYGSEIFIGGLPRDVSNDDLRDLCEPFGDIFEVSSHPVGRKRLMWMLLFCFAACNINEFVCFVSVMVLISQLFGR